MKWNFSFHEPNLMPGFWFHNVCLFVCLLIWSLWNEYWIFFLNFIFAFCKKIFRYRSIILGDVFFGKFFFRLPGWNKHQPNLFWGKFLVFSLPSNPFSWFSGCLFSRKLFFLAKEFSLFYFCWFKNRSTKEKKSILFPFSNRNILFSLSFPFHRRM